MPRIRTIKPDAFKSDSLSQIPRGVRWTFAGLWTYADDAGRARDDARLIKAELYPLDDDMTVIEVQADLALLVDIGGICRYEVNGKRYLHLPNWWHQKINRPTPSKLPPCPEHEDGMSGHVIGSDDSVNAHGGLTEDSPPERKGKEGEREGNGESVSRELTLAEAPRADVDRICEHLATAIEDNGSKRPAITAKWRQAARLMLDKDGRTEEEIHGAIEWSQRDEFWRANILSLPTLREKYDTLRLQAQRRGRPTRQQETDDLFAAAARRMGVDR